MGGTNIRQFGLTIGILAAGLGVARAQDDAPFRLAVPPEMIEVGFMKHLLPRFRFRTQISIDPVAAGAGADIAFVPGGDAGTQVFVTPDGQGVRLVRLNDDAVVAKKFERFQSWLQSDPGVAAIEGFPPDGPALYSTAGPVEIATVEEVIDGDVAAGSKLSLQHCGRCHVIDKRNRMGGIGSTPSFAALRGRTGWSNLFRAFYSENPHPSFTQVKDVTDPFPSNRPAHIAPVEITLGEIDAILAFVATLEPKDLGLRVRSE